MTSHRRRGHPQRGGLTANSTPTQSMLSSSGLALKQHPCSISYRNPHCKVQQRCSNTRMGLTIPSQTLPPLSLSPKSLPFLLCHLPPSPTFTMSQPPYPIHPSVLPKLDPTYLSFYNAHIFDKQQVHLQPVAASRTSGVLLPGASPLLPVGSTVDYAIKRIETSGPDVPVRVFTPEGDKPEDGWPVMVWYHGGGWVLGNIDTENTICTNLCRRAGVVVVSVDYRYILSIPKHMNCVC